MKVLVGTMGLIAISSSARSLYLKDRLDLILGFALIFLITTAVRWCNF